MDPSKIFINEDGLLRNGWRLFLSIFAKVFINNYRRLRSGWRVLLFVGAFLSISAFLATGLRIAYGALHMYVPPIPHPEYFTEIVFRTSLLVSALLAGFLCTRLIEGLPWKALGLTFHVGWLRDFLIGSAVGIFSLMVAVAIATIAGGLHFSQSGREIIFSTFKSLISSAALFLIAGLAEEAMFRGYPLQTLARAHLVWLGVLLTFVLFASVHLANPNVVPGFTFANTALAGAWLAVAYLRTRSLWLPMGVHWAWNWALGGLFGLPVSGVNLVSYPLLQARDSGPVWLTGGTYGIEGGLACTVALLLSILFLWRSRLISATPELKKLTSEEVPAIPSPRVSIRPAD